jgi:hypothetical protein
MSAPKRCLQGNPTITDELLKGKQLEDRTYKVHLDGYDQTDLITGQGPSKRHEVWYFAQTSLGALRYDNYKYQFIVMGNGALPNGPSYRAHPRLYLSCRSAKSASTSVPGRKTEEVRGQALPTLIDFRHCGSQ